MLEKATTPACCSLPSVRIDDGAVVVCLAGNPNVGKSSIFNRLTGAEVETAHYAGLTVESTSATAQWDDRHVSIVDLPGFYGAGAGGDEQREGWMGLFMHRPDVVVTVVDATNLARNLYLVLQLIDLGLPQVVALNLSDVARRHHLVIDAGLLERELGVPVVSTAASTGEGIERLQAAVLAEADRRREARADGDGTTTTIARETTPTGARATPGPGPDGRRYSAAVEDRLAALAAGLEARDERRQLAFGLTPRAAAFALLEGIEELACTLDPDAVAAVVEAEADAVPRATAVRVGPGHVAVGTASGRSAAGRAAATRWRGRRAAPARGRCASPASATPRRAHCRAAPPIRRAAPRAANASGGCARRRRPGLPILFGVLAAILGFLFVVGGFLSTALTDLWNATAGPALESAVTAVFGSGDLGQTILWGLDGGILAALAVGIPYILTFYFALALLEDSGYMNAAAYLTDRVMHRVGLHGQAVIPLVASAGCSVPAVLGTRVLPTMRERVIAGTLISLAPCSARTAVIMGGVALYAGWQWAVFVYAVIALVGLTAGVLLNAVMPGESSALIMEVFPLRRPALKLVARKTWNRFREFVWVAAPIIVLGSMALGALYETGLAWRLTEPLEPIVVGWLGLPAVAGLTLLFAVLRKELALQLLVVFAVGVYGPSATDLSTFMTTTQLVVYAVVCCLYIPCVATIAVLGRELGRWRAALISAGTVGTALLVGGVINQVWVHL